mmetsp:Transcript_6204/g.13506  ORF Transcript_6204/g.13506 Transcript_6204/m.13506 type:complete len:234 (-) Transcript_6204:871-1572(-)
MLNLLPVARLVVHFPVLEMIAVHRRVVTFLVGLVGITLLAVVRRLAYRLRESFAIIMVRRHLMYRLHHVNGVPLIVSSNARSNRASTTVGCCGTNFKHTRAILRRVVIASTLQRITSSIMAMAIVVITIVVIVPSHHTANNALEHIAPPALANHRHAALATFVARGGPPSFQPPHQFPLGVGTIHRGRFSQGGGGGAGHGRRGYIIAQLEWNLILLIVHRRDGIEPIHSDAPQ